MRKRTSPWLAAVTFLCVGLAASACGGTPASPSEGREQLTVKVTTAHFQILADRAQTELLNAIATQLEANYARVTSDLRVGSLSTTSVWIWDDSDSYYDDMRARGNFYYGATGYVLIAQYESGSFIDPRTIDYMRAGRYPSIAELDAAWNVSGQVYQVGYVLGEFIVSRWGHEGLVRLVRLNGDIAGALSATTGELESGWRAFLHKKYGLPA